MLVRIAQATKNAVGKCAKIVVVASIHYLVKILRRKTMKDKEKQFKEKIMCGEATIIEEVEITEKTVRKSEDNADAFVNLLNQEQAELHVEHQELPFS